MAKSSGRLFPTFLDKGTRDPAAVRMLQVILLCRAANPNIIVDGDYGDETAKGVKELQRNLHVAVDGNFGPQTRAAFKVKFGVDVDTLPA
jgi:peptidoglycan hydrolase-like protein with peptidoglycan-binding domain